MRSRRGKRTEERSFGSSNLPLLFSWSQIKWQSTLCPGAANRLNGECRIRSSARTYDKTHKAWATYKSKRCLNPIYRLDVSPCRINESNSDISCPTSFPRVCRCMVLASLFLHVIRRGPPKFSGKLHSTSFVFPKLFSKLTEAVFPLIYTNHI